MGRKCVGFVEAVGLAAALQAADTIAKSANVRLLGYEYSGYDGHILIKFEGNAGAIKAAAEAAVVAIHKVHTDFDQTTAVNLEKTGLDEAVYDVLVHNKNTVGDPLQIASDKRPQGTNRQAKWVGHWEQKGCYILKSVYLIATRDLRISGCNFFYLKIKGLCDFLRKRF